MYEEMSPFLNLVELFHHWAKLGSEEQNAKSVESLNVNKWWHFSQNPLKTFPCNNHLQRKADCIRADQYFSYSSASQA